METQKERLLIYGKEQHALSQMQIEKRLGLGNGTIAHSKGNLSLKVINSALREFPDLSRVWLITGAGDMIAKESITQNIYAPSGNVSTGDGNTQTITTGFDEEFYKGEVERLKKEVEELKEEKKKLFDLLMKQ